MMMRNFLTLWPLSLIPIIKRWHRGPRTHHKVQFGGEMAPKVMRVESDTFCDTSIHKTKGQLISKGLFGILNSPKKRTKKFSFTTIAPQVDLFSFLVWKKLNSPKGFSKFTDLYLACQLTLNLWILILSSSLFFILFILFYLELFDWGKKFQYRSLIYRNTKQICSPFKKVKKVLASEFRIGFWHLMNILLN